MSECLTMCAVCDWWVSVWPCVQSVTDEWVFDHVCSLWLMSECLTMCAVCDWWVSVWPCVESVSNQAGLLSLTAKAFTCRHVSQHRKIRTDRYALKHTTTTTTTTTTIIIIITMTTTTKTTTTTISTIQFATHVSLLSCIISLLYALFPLCVLYFVVLG